MTKAISLKFFCPTLTYILLLIQITAFYYQNIFTQKQQNNKQLTQLKIQQSNSKNTEAQKQNIQTQINDLNNSNTQISNQLTSNANQGSITINSAQDVNILASQNITNNHSSYNETNMMYSIQDNHDLQVQTTVSPLLSSNNITINADGGNGNINLLSAIITGQGNLDLNGNVNMQSLQDLYYQYDFSQATSMNLGALLGMLLAAVVIGAVTGGAGALALGAIGAATVTVGTAVIGAAIASAVGVALQLGITAAIDANNGGAAATQAMQSGHMDSTTKQYQALVGNSLLFGGNVSTGSNSSIDSATSIQSNNINQTADNQESASYAEEHKDIGPDWNKLMMDAAINGVVSGVTVAAGPLIEVGIGKAASFITTGLNNMGLSSVVDGISVVASKTSSVIDDITNVTGISKITGMLDDVTKAAAKSIDDGLSKIGVQQTKYYGINFGSKTTLAREWQDTFVNTNKFDDILDQYGSKAAHNPYVENVKGGNTVALRGDQLMKDSRYTQRFSSEPKTHSVTKTKLPHYGDDIVSKNPDKSIHIAGDGKIIEVRNQFNDKTGTGWGNTVKIEHYDDFGNKAYTTRYAHMEKLPDLKPDQYVKEGDVVGQMGATGGVSGPHLHFEIEKYNPAIQKFVRVPPGDINVGKYENLSDLPKK